jgi:hypothetical protein
VAKKSRTPPPPRRVQAPRTRAGATDRRQRTILYALAGSGLVMLVLVLAVLAFANRGSDAAPAGNPGPALRAAGCTLKTYEGLSQSHVHSLDAKVKWNSFPPSSGPHYDQPAPWGFYDEPLNQRIVVHNLEHGGVAIQYGNRVPPQTRDQLQEFYRKDPRGLIVAPLPALKDEIALTAWTAQFTKGGKDLIAFGRVAKCSRFDAKAFDAFVSAFRFKGPESCLTEGQTRCFRPQDLEPGE